MSELNKKMEDFVKGKPTNKAGELTNPTKADVAKFNREFSTTRNNKGKVMEALKRMKGGVIDKTADVLSAPARAYYGVKGKISDMKADSRIANRNFNNRQDNSNFYKGNDYWKKNKN